MVDELREADEHWDSYFISNKVWIYADEYRAELTGDEDYSRIIIHSDANEGWLYSRRLEDKQQVQATLAAIEIPVSEQQLQALGFIKWKDAYI